MKLRLALSAVLLVAFGHAATAHAAGLSLPATSFGPGHGNLNAGVPNVWGPPNVETCTFGAGVWGPNHGLDHCTAQAASNSFTDPNDTRSGTASATGQAFIDVHGLHAYSAVSGVGSVYPTADVNASAGDGIWNRSGQTLSFSVQFHVDGLLTAKGNAGTFLEVLQTSPGKADIPLWSAMLPWGTNAQIPLDLNLSTQPLTLAPGAWAGWGLKLHAYSWAASANGGPILQEALASTNAGHTLSFTSISLTDLNGQAVDPSVLQSQYGWTYTAAVPEASSAAMSLAGLLILGLKLRRRRPG